MLVQATAAADNQSFSIESKRGHRYSKFSDLKSQWPGARLSVGNNDYAATVRI